ncbi:MAG: flagellar basal-body MS-ring/collar protein FliF [Planctomycetaceae bacterium]
MEFFRTLTEQLRALWSGWSNSQRAGISAAAIGCLAAVAGTLYWATRPEYVVLASSLTPQQAAEMVGVLETEQIETKLNFSGSSVSVPRSDVSRARLALKDVLEPNLADDNDSFASGFPGSPAEEEDRRRRTQETRIAKSIEQIRGIRSAIVHISRPVPSPFAVEKTPSTASIIIDPSSVTAVTPSVAESIVSMVSRAVEGLSPENVTLMDTSGRQYSMNDGIASAMSGQFEYQQRLELRLAGKAESMLARMLGEGKAVVRVTADIDFRETTRIEQTFDPDGKVKTDETIETVSQTGAVSLAAGAVGASANASLPADLEDPSATFKSERNTTSYDNASINETVRDIPGRINRLTVAAIVDLTVPEPVEGQPAPPAIDPTQIENIIKQAVGFDTARGDEVQVVNAPLESPVLIDEVPPLVTTWQQYQPLVQSLLVGMAAFAAFIMGLLLLRKVKPVVVASEGEAAMSLQEMQRLSALSQQAKNNPEVAAQILRAWLGDSEEEESAARPPEKTAPTRRAA